MYLIYKAICQVVGYFGFQQISILHLSIRVLKTYDFNANKQLCH